MVTSSHIMSSFYCDRTQVQFITNKTKHKTKCSCWAKSTLACVLPKDRKWRKLLCPCRARFLWDKRSSLLLHNSQRFINFWVHDQPLDTVL